MVASTADTGSSAEVVVVGDGIAGLSAAIFTARHDLETLILGDGESILRRNAHLENYPGFPAGINARLLLEMMGEQADRAGCDRREATVTHVDPLDEGFAVETAFGDRYETRYVIAATRNAVGYLADVEGLGVIDRGKTFLETDERGRTGVEGLYAAGRIAEKPYQAVVSAGHGAEVAVTLLEDDDQPFYHDWVTPEGYFTGRGRDLPPGCEEVDDVERRRREDESRDVVREYVAERHPDDQQTHPSLREE